MNECKEITVMLTEREQEYLKEVLEAEKAIYLEQNDYYQTNTALRDLNDKRSNCQSVLDKINDAQNRNINNNKLSEEQETNDTNLQNEIERMVTRFFLNNVQAVYSDNHEWKIEKDSVSVAQICFNNKSACQIKDSSDTNICGFDVVPAYAEMDGVANYVGKALESLNYAVNVRYKYYDEELDLTQGNERSR